MNVEAVVFFDPRRPENANIVDGLEKDKDLGTQSFARAKDIRCAAPFAPEAVYANLLKRAQPEEYRPTIVTTDVERGAVCRCDVRAGGRKHR